MTNADRPIRRSEAMLAVAFALMAVGTVAAGAFYYRSVSQHYHAQVTASISAIADLKEDGLVQWRKERLVDAALLQNRAFAALARRWFEHPSDEAAQGELVDSMRKYPELSQYDQIQLVDARGRIRLSVPEGRTDLASVIASALPEVIRSRRIVLQDFYRDEHDRRIYLAVLVPLVGESNAGPALGAVVLRMDPGVFLYPYISRWPTPSATAETLLIRRDGDAILFLNNLRFRPDAALRFRVPLHRTDVAGVQAALGTQGSVAAVDYRDVPIVAALRKIPDSPWMLVARIDAAEVDAPVRERLWLVVVVIFALLLALGTSMALVWRQRVLDLHRERLDAALKLQQSERRYRELSESLPQLIWTCEEDGRCDYLSPQWVQYTGIPEAEQLGFGWLDRLHPEDREQTIAAWQAAVDARTNFDVEFRINRHDGVYRWFKTRAVAFRDDDGRILKWFGSNTDIDDQRHAEAEIRQLNADLEARVRERTAALTASNTELEAFSYSVSHDLRAPLRAIVGYGRILTEEHGAHLCVEGRRVLGVICSEGRRMAQLIDDLLAFSRVGRRTMTRTDVDMTELARAVFADQSAQAPGRALRLELKPLPPAYGDPSLIRVVLTNLLSNAVKFTRDRVPGVVEITGARQDGHVTYHVRDNGAGFDMRYVSKLFGVFQRLHSADAFEGTGIGLALARRIVHRHGGDMTAEARVDEGAVFSFSLPDRKDA